MPDTDWWVAVAVPPALELLGFFGLELFDRAGLIREGGSALAVLVPGFAVVTSLLLIPVFALGLYKDATAVRAAGETWDPNPTLWAAVGLVVPLVGVAASTSTLMVFIATVYFIRRFRSSPQVTIPDEADGAGEGDTATRQRTATTSDQASAQSTTVSVWDDGETDGSAQSTHAGEPPTSSTAAGDIGRVSRWWYGIAVPLCAYGVLLLLVPVLGFLFGGDPRMELLQSLSTVSIFLAFAAAVAILTLFLSTPVYAAALFLDARAVAESDADWTPNTAVWGTVGALHLLNLFVPLVWFVSGPVGLFYLWKRHAALGSP